MIHLHLSIASGLMPIDKSRIHPTAIMDRHRLLTLLKRTSG
jgi:hypothetical protein